MALASVPEYGVGQYMSVSLVSNSNEAIRTILPRIKGIHADVSASAKAELVTDARQHPRDGSTARCSGLQPNHTIPSEKACTCSTAMFIQADY
jgi:hypothetical protein